MEISRIINSLVVDSEEEEDEDEDEEGEDKNS